MSTLEIHFLFFRNEFREGTYTTLWGVRTLITKTTVFVAAPAEKTIVGYTVSAIGIYTQNQQQ